MYFVEVQASFSSAHYLRGYKGKCESLHGHNWKVQVSAKAQTLNELGMVVDFSELKIGLKAVLEELDHKCLNELEAFKAINPSSENICRYIFDKLNLRLDLKTASLSQVRVWETETSCATYQPQINTQINTQIKTDKNPD